MRSNWIFSGFCSSSGNEHWTGQSQPRGQFAGSSKGNLHRIFGAIEHCELDDFGNQEGDGDRNVLSSVNRVELQIDDKAAGRFRRTRAKLGGKLRQERSQRNAATSSISAK